MKIVIDIPEMAYEAYKEWNKNMVATVEQSIIANGTPYEDKIEQITDLLETEWGYEGIREDVSRILRGEKQ